MLLIVVGSINSVAAAVVVDVSVVDASCCSSSCCCCSAAGACRRRCGGARAERAPNPVVHRSRAGLHIGGKFCGRFQVLRPISSWNCFVALL